MHPYNASDVDEDAIAQLRALAGHPHVKAIGEIGLDYFNEFSPRADQRRAFPRQLELAIELDLPVVIHDRQADADTLAILDEYRARLTGCVIHCFGSDAVFAAACAERDFYVSFAGNVTFPKAQALRDAAAVVPLERLLIETDAPYLAPQPKRGQRCEPIFVEHTVMTLSDVKCVDLETLVSSTTANARRFFGIV
jgi:TatD DNase family protein